MVADELPGLGNDWRIHVCSLHHELVALNREMFGKDAKQSGQGFKFALRSNRGSEKSQLGPFVIDVLAELPGFINGVLERSCGRLPAHHLACLQEPDGLRTK